MSSILPAGPGHPIGRTTSAWCPASTTLWPLRRRPNTTHTSLHHDAPPPVQEAHQLASPCMYTSRMLPAHHLHSLRTWTFAFHHGCPNPPSTSSSPPNMLPLPPDSCLVSLMPLMDPYSPSRLRFPFGRNPSIEWHMPAVTSFAAGRLWSRTCSRTLLIKMLPVLRTTVPATLLVKELRTVP